MTMIQKSTFSILILFVLMLVGSCKPKEDIVLRDVRDIIVDATTEPLLKANAILYNPNNIKIKLRKVNVEVYVNGKKSGIVDQEPRMVIPAEAEFTVPLEVKLNMKEMGVLDTIFGIIGSKKLKVRYKGSISITYKGLPIRIPVDYESDVKLRF
ncbi:MAG TPA: LEA type 2 family protein [Cyclobacteriaceae bacterium]